MAENGWNSQKPEKIALAYTVGACCLLGINFGLTTFSTHLHYAALAAVIPSITNQLCTDSEWRNRTEHVKGRPAIIDFLTRQRLACLVLVLGIRPVLMLE